MCSKTHGIGTDSVNYHYPRQFLNINYVDCKNTIKIQTLSELWVFFMCWRSIFQYVILLFTSFPPSSHSCSTPQKGYIRPKKRTRCVQNIHMQQHIVRVGIYNDNVNNILPLLFVQNVLKVQYAEPGFIFPLRN